MKTQFWNFFLCTTSSQISRQFRQYITRFAHVVNSLSRQYSLFIKDYVGYVWICLRNSETKDMYLLIFWRNMIFSTALSTMKMVRGAWYFSSQGEVLKHLHNSFNIGPGPLVIRNWSDDYQKASNTILVNLVSKTYLIKFWQPKDQVHKY